MITHNLWTINQYDFEQLKHSFDLNEPYEGAQQLSNIINQVIQQLVCTINAELSMNECDTVAGKGLYSSAGLNGDGGISIDPVLLEQINSNTMRLNALEPRVNDHDQNIIDLDEAMNTPAPAIVDEEIANDDNYDSAMRLLK